MKFCVVSIEAKVSLRGFLTAYGKSIKVNRGNSVRNSTTFSIIAATFTPHVANSTKLPPAKQLSYSWLHIEFGDSNINIFENNNIFYFF